MDNSIAMKYYQLASEVSSDSEFRTKMVFMASKAELNEWYLQNKSYEKDFKFCVSEDSINNYYGPLF